MMRVVALVVMGVGLWLVGALTNDRPGAWAGQASEPCKPGLTVGQRPGPYSFDVSTGPERGRPTCFVCDTADRPGAIVFARSLSLQLGKLLSGLDAAMGKQQQQKDRLQAWMTMLDDGKDDLDGRIVAFSKTHAIRHMPLGAFTDSDGPPAYRLSREADVTVILFVQRKVTASFAFRAGELTDQAIEQILGQLPKMP